MNLYEAISVRRSVRSYTAEVVSEEKLDAIRRRFRELPNLFGDIETDITIVNGQLYPIGLSRLQAVKAPYYIVFYSEKAPRYQMNMGFLMEQTALFLCSEGFGTCFVGNTNVRKDLRTKGELELTGILAFGITKESHIRKRTEAKRLPLEELCVYKEVPRQWMKQLLQAARLAPSSMNSQPWRFVVYDDRIHIFTKKHRTDQLGRYHWEEVNFGIMFAHIMIAAEEYWLDVDLIRLENISHKNFPNNQYVLSAIMKS